MDRAATIAWLRSAMKGDYQTIGVHSPKRRLNRVGDRANEITINLRTRELQDQPAVRPSHVSHGELARPIEKCDSQLPRAAPLKGVRRVAENVLHFSEQ